MTRNLFLLDWKYDNSVTKLFLSFICVSSRSWIETLWESFLLRIPHSVLWCYCSLFKVPVFTHMVLKCVNRDVKSLRDGNPTHLWHPAYHARPKTITVRDTFMERKYFAWMLQRYLNSWNICTLCSLNRKYTSLFFNDIRLIAK